MLTFYYLNETEIGRQYEQLLSDSPDTYSTETTSHRSMSGAAKVGGAFKVVADLGGETRWESSSSERRSYERKSIDKLLAVWDRLQTSSRLLVLADDRAVASVAVGASVFVDGRFRLVREEEGTAFLCGEASGCLISIVSSVEHMPPSIRVWLRLQDDGVPMNVYGIVSNAAEHALDVRPVAIGTGFIDHFKDGEP